MMGITITEAAITTQIGSFMAIPVVVPIVAAILAIGIVGIVLTGLSI